MPSVLTGANLANRDLIYLGVSGDGDSASIGFGQFAHSIRRAVNMTYIAKPKFHHPGLPKNELGYTHRDYEGKVSTLCAGCGHDSITASIIEACFQLSIEPHRVAKISGIGCSSKTPDYFLGNSHGFNTCLLYTSPSPRDRTRSRMPSSA